MGCTGTLGQGADRIVNLVNQTTTHELFSVLREARALVTGDSGPMHVAVALGTPVVAIHGPTHPEINGPYLASRAAIVRQPLACSPCYRLDRVANCPLGHTLCQRLIGPETVYGALRALLAECHTPALREPS
jgi:ADP-heptose:LPS heptosyltransferase